MEFHLFRTSAWYNDETDTKETIKHKILGEHRKIIESKYNIEVIDFEGGLNVLIDLSSVESIVELQGILEHPLIIYGVNILEIYDDYMK